MANLYKNAFYDPTVTTPVTVYTTPVEKTALIKNIQLTNESGSKVVKVYVRDNSASTDYQIAYASFSGTSICNLIQAPIVLEQGDLLKIETSSTTGISGIISLLEVYY